MPTQNTNKRGRHHTLCRLWRVALPVALLTSCTCQKLPVHGWRLVYISENVKGYYHTFESVPSGTYTLQQQFDSVVCPINDTVNLYGRKRIKRIEL